MRQQQIGFSVDVRWSCGWLISTLIYLVFTQWINMLLIWMLCNRSIILSLFFIVSKYLSLFSLHLNFHRWEWDLECNEMNGVKLPPYLIVFERTTTTSHKLFMIRPRCISRQHSWTATDDHLIHITYMHNNNLNNFNIIWLNFKWRIFIVVKITFY